MAKQFERNTEGLKKYAEKQNLETIAKVNKAIDKLKRSKAKKINFKNVAEEAGVAKATLYNNSILKERILSLRGINNDSQNEDDHITSLGKNDLKDRIIKRQYAEIKKLKDEQGDLIIQLIDTKELKDKIRSLEKRQIELFEKYKEQEEHLAKESAMRVEAERKLEDTTLKLLK